MIIRHCVICDRLCRCYDLDEVATCWPCAKRIREQEDAFEAMVEAEDSDDARPDGRGASPLVSAEKYVEIFEHWPTKL